MSIARTADLVKSCAAWIAAHELAFLAAAAPFLLFPNRWTVAAFGVLVLTWLCRWLTLGRLSVRTALDLPIALLLLMALVGAAVSLDPAMTRAKLWGLVLEAALFFGLANALKTESSVRAMAVVLVAGTAGVAVVSLVGTDWQAVRLVSLPGLYDRLPRLALGLPGSGVPRASSLFHPREVGATLALLLPLPLVLLLFGRDRPLRLLSAAAVVVGGAVLLLSQSLQALLGLALAVAVMAAWRSRWALLGIALAVLAAGAALWAAGPSRAALALLSADHPIGIGVLLRLDMWSRAWAMLGDMPYTGIGLNTFPLVQTHFYPGVMLGPEVHAHNLFLQTALDLGLPGLAAFLWLAVAFFAGVAADYRATAQAEVRLLLVGLAAGVAAFLGNGLLDAVTLGAKPTAALFAMLGLAAAAGRLGQGETVEGVERASPARPAPGRAAPLAALLGLTVLSLLAWPSSAALNLGAVRAHQVLFRARQAGSLPATDLRATLAALDRAALGPGAGHAHDLLGSLYAWQGDEAAALAELERAVAADGAGSIGRYAPWLLWQRRLLGEAQAGTWQDLLQVYGAWTARYPERAENVLRLALLYDRGLGQAAQARATLRAGLEGGAVPAGLLAHALSHLEP